jgi:hypothetical protein
MDGMVVVVIALRAFTNVTHHRFFSSGMSKLAFFLRQRLDLDEHGSSPSLINQKKPTPRYQGQLQDEQIYWVGNV